MKPVLLISLLFCLQIQVDAQEQNIDSLKHLLSIAKEDSIRVLLLARLSYSYSLSNPDTALKLGQEGLVLAHKINYAEGVYHCRQSLSETWRGIGDYPTAIKLALSNFSYVESLDKPSLLQETCGQLTSNYRDQGDYQEALKYAFKGLEIDRQNFKCNLCGVWYAVIASVYYELNQLDSAKFFFDKYYQYPVDAWNKAWILAVGGRIYAKAGNYDSAFSFYRLAIDALKKVNNLNDLARADNSLADLYLATGNRDSAVVAAQAALQIAQINSFNKEVVEASLLISKGYEKVNVDSAFYYFKLATAARDSLYNQEKTKQILSFQFNEKLRQQEVENQEAQDKNKLRVYLLLFVLIVFLIIGIILLRTNLFRKKAYALLQRQKADTDWQKAKAEQALDELKSAQAQLVQREKMASLGELTAGIAHEIQNPLNFVNNFSDVNTELIDELKAQLVTGNGQEAIIIADDIQENEQKINYHGKRADAIVKGMLQHSRVSSGKKEPTDINALADEYLRLSYHGLKAKDKSFNATIETHFDESIGKTEVIPQDIGRVLLNLFNNAFYVVNERRKTEGLAYEPTVAVTTKKLYDKIEVRVKDNGTGIPQKAVDKIFQPFFTTKPTGQGTGLGLSLSYDIIKAHGGELKVETKEGEGAEFTMQLPSNT